MKHSENTQSHQHRPANKHPHVVLIGPTGAGKTTVGRRLAGFLRMPFYDVDESLEAATGVSVNLIFEIEKEAGFRLRESRMLAQLLAGPAAVIATGAGIVVNEENRQQLQQANTVVVYLKTTVERQLERLSHDKRRPLLQVPDREQRLHDMAAVRNPLYDAMSDLTVPTGQDNPYHMARTVYRQLQSFLATWQPPERNPE